MAGMTGLTFGPPTQGGDQAHRRQGAALQPGTSAVDVLSMQLPKVLGPGAITPRSLLTPDAGSTGAAGFSPESAVLQSVMRAFPQFSRGVAGPAPAVSAPAPSAMGLPAVSGAASGQAGPMPTDLLTMLRAAMGPMGGPRIAG